MQVFEGTIVTCDDTRRVTRYLVEDKGRIVHTGDVLPEAFRSLPVQSLGQGSLLPAFGDTHIHFMSHSLFEGGLDVRSSRSVDDTVGLIADYCRTRPDKLVLGFGASPHSVREGRMPTRDDLDRACGDRLVYIVKYDGHAAVANSKLLAALPDVARTSRGFDGESGLLSQDAFFRATDYVTGLVSLPATLHNMLGSMDRLAARGMGMVHSVSGVGFPGDLDVGLERLFARGLRNPVAYRVFFQTMDVSKALKRRLPRIGGCFATALDGCFGSVDAALHEPYAHDPSNRGVLYFEDSRVVEFAKSANRAGLQIEIHAIGDRAFDQAVAALSAALEDFPRTDHRHTIIHACLPTPRGLETCARLGIAFAVQPSFIQWDLEPLGYLETILGKRAHDLNPLGTIARQGIVMTGGSDAPCTVPDPIQAIWAACNHYNQAESLGLQAAIDLYTRNAAWGVFDEKERGSLEPGKRADFVVLDGNPFAMKPADLNRLKVDRLYLGGSPYKPGQGRLSLLTRGLVSRRTT